MKNTAWRSFAWAALSAALAFPAAAWAGGASDGAASIQTFSDYAAASLADQDSWLKAKFCANKLTAPQKKAFMESMRAADPAQTKAFMQKQGVVCAQS